MNVVFNPANEDWLAIKVGQDATEVTMQFFAQRVIAQEWAALFGGKHRVNQNLRKGLWHGCRIRKRRARFNSFRVGDVHVTPSQGSSCLATLG